MVHFGVFALGFAWPYWTFIVASCVAARTDVKEQEIIGPHQPILATLGDNVILPCHVAPKSDVQYQTVEWSLPDLKPDPSDRLSRVEFVFVYREQREEVDLMLQAYVGRTALFEDELKNGNISLKITNVTLEDAGRYRCFIPKLKGSVKEAIVDLVVESNAITTWTMSSPLPPGTLQPPDPNNETDVKGGRLRLWVLILVLLTCVLLILSAGAVGCFFLKRDVSQKETKCFAAYAEV